MLGGQNQDIDFGDDHNGFPIQTAIWPQKGISTEISVHFTIKGPAYPSLSQSYVDFSAGGRLSTNSYYNLFNLGKWHRQCGPLPIELWLQGEGRFYLTIWIACKNKSHEQIYSEVISLDGLTKLPFESDISPSTNGIVFFELTALETARLDDFCWATSMAPRQTPKLVLAVTTFQREAQVAITAERFRAFRRHSGLRNFMQMLIIDNGRTLELQEDDSVTVIPNANLGGAGGFTRGLLTARALGASHCLFMDDDASIQMEAISRSWWYLAYAINPRTAVAGSMIEAGKKWRLWENGARFERGCKPMFSGLDLRDSEQVFHMEYETTAPTPDGFYAGWWFFAFPIAHVDHLSFPFFVRGDDVSFSLSNDFNIVTLPGVASIQESFIDKASPLTWYLDFRSHLVHHLSLPKQNVSWWKLQKMVANFYLRTILRFHYDSLSAVNLAFEDILQGPEFFSENADMSKRRADIKLMIKEEIWKPLQKQKNTKLGKCKRPIRALLLLTLNGHLLPLPNRIGSKLIIPAAHRENFREVYGAKEISYLNNDQTAFYVVQMDRLRFLHETFRLAKNSIKLGIRYRKYKRDWQRNYAPLTSEKFWTRKLNLNPASE